MKRSRVHIAGLQLTCHHTDVLVVGSGAAGLSAADHLWRRGVRDMALLTEGMRMGTSRNTGSDKQTYYKLNLSGDTPDSVRAMARDLFAGGAMHGDIALALAALSPVAFSRLVQIGVPFPHNEYGEYIGYRTDHDQSTRATSAGPLTSRHMTECLEAQVRAHGIPVLEPMQVIAVIPEGSGPDRRVAGVLVLDRTEAQNPRFALVRCGAVIYATGGPAGLYADRVYPSSQTGATGIALEAGAPAVNLTEWQYGIASVKFRWNLSGTYQQVLPRYVSTAPDGTEEREFLREQFASDRDMLSAVFLKGYQWPFDVRRLTGAGSSRVDMAVYNEQVRRGRRVFLDFRSNPAGLDLPLRPEAVGDEAWDYLSRSGALDGTPLDRLRGMNPDAVKLYADHGIDLSAEKLEIAVCAQHHNGGLEGDLWWQSPLAGFYPVGEANGAFGVYRPGGSALNETQVGSFRAAEHIARTRPEAPGPEAFLAAASSWVRHRADLVRTMRESAPSDLRLEPVPYRRRLQRRMTEAAGILRDAGRIRGILEECRAEWADAAAGQRVRSGRQVALALRNYDLLVTQIACLQAMLDTAEQKMGSRGSGLWRDPEGTLAWEDWRYTPDSGRFDDRIQQVRLKGEEPGPGPVDIRWQPVRPVPDDEPWFERDWAEYRRRWKPRTEARNEIEEEQ